MEPDAPSVRGAFAAVHGGGGFDGLFDLGPAFPLNLSGIVPGALGGGAAGADLALHLVTVAPSPVGGSRAAAAAAQQQQQQQQQQQVQQMPPPPPMQLPRLAGVSGPVRGLPAALQPAPEELMRFGGAGLHLPKAPPLQREGSGSAGAKAILPPMHVIEG
jgi:hypothetical protein